MGTGAERPQEPTNTELMVALEDLQERAELLQELTETLITHLIGDKFVPEWRRRRPEVVGQQQRLKTRPYSCGCMDVSDLFTDNLVDTVRCPAHMGIKHMSHPDRP